MPEFNKLTTTEFLLKNILLVLSALFGILILFITHLMASFLVPIFIAFFTAFLLQPSIRQLSHMKVPTWLSAIVVIFVFTMILFLFFIILIISFQTFLYDLPDITREFRTIMMKALTDLSKNESFYRYVDQERYVDIILELVTKINFGSYMLGTMTKTFDIMKNFILYIISLIFILPGTGNLGIKVAKAFPGKGRKIQVLFYNITKQIQSYIIVKSLVSLLIGGITFLICLLFRVEYPLLWGFVTFLFNYIPYVGSIFAVPLPVILSYIQFQNLPISLLLMVTLTTFQMIIGNIVEPKFYSKGTNLSAIVVFTSLMIWGYIWGIAGVFLAVPIMSAFNLICENIESLKPISYLITVKKYRRRKKKKLFSQNE